MQEIKTDFLIIGSGIAGLSFALKAAKFGKVALITKKEEAESNTNYAQGGIASVISNNDSFELHIKDTLIAGAGLCHEDAVQIIVREGPSRVRELMELGVNFTRKESGELDLGREGGHSKNRIVHAKDLTGREIERALLNAVEKHSEIDIYENHIAIELITEHHLENQFYVGGTPAELLNQTSSVSADKTSIESSRGNHSNNRSIHCWGAYALDIKRGVIKTFLAKATILSTGGAGQVYLHTTNPNIATGDGIAMAHRAGAKIANLEFMQFHPTSLYHPEAQSFLISEAVRGYGGILKNKDGCAFMEKYDKRGSLAPRDIVARAIDTEMKKRGESCVYLDVRHLDAEETKRRFPHIYEKCLKYKIDITTELIPVVPAAHYTCGGVVTDMEGRTSIEGLYACGEVACTGVHGANRLASNSLLEAVVFSDRAVKNSADFVANYPTSFPKIPHWNEEGTFNSEEWVLVSHDKREIQQLMWDYVGIVRSDLRLKRALRRIELISEEIEDFYKRTKVTSDLIELRNIAAVAKLIIRCALQRKESRGLHYTSDYPESDESQCKDTVIVNPVS